MKRFNITVGSVTQALKGRDILRKNGFRVSIKKSSTDDTSMGCAYNIVIEDNDPNKAVRILHKNGIIVKSVR